MRLLTKFNRITCSRRLWMAAFCALLAGSSPAQTNPPANQVITIPATPGNRLLRVNIADSLTRWLTDYSSVLSPEKMYVHTDRSFYLAGEMIWCKLYALNGTDHTPSDLSQVAYLEVMNAERNPVLQAKIALNQGSGQGSFYLPATLESGNYIVRAYTSWMKNAGPEWFFEKPVTVVNTFRKLNLPEAATKPFDLQFFPEGGNLVSGIPSRVAFKATGPDGTGIPVEGILINQHNDTLARFAPLKFGMGSFAFQPQPGDTYQALVRTPDAENYRRVAFPPVQAQGLVMQVAPAENNQVQVTVRASPDLTPEVYLLVHTRGVAKTALMSPLQQGTAVFRVPLERLDEGISHLTVFDAQARPRSERLYFRRPRQKLAIETATDRGEYPTRTKVTLDLRTRNPESTPTDADLSVAVFRTDSLQAVEPGDILSYLWLSSDLRGTIESPGFYFDETNPQADEALDNLMLSQGWRRFRWENVLQGPPQSFPHVAEHGGHMIRGRVINTQTGEPAAGVLTYLASPSLDIRVYGSRSDSSGRIQFEVQDYYGPRELILQTNILTDSIYRFEISSPFSGESPTTSAHAFSLPESLRDPLISRSIHMQVQNIHYLNRMNQFRPHRTVNRTFYGEPDKVYLLDDYTRFQVMEEVMREYVQPVMVRRRRGKFHFIVMDNPRKSVFREDPMILLDGVPVFDADRIMAFDPLQIKRLDVFARKYLYGALTFSGLVSFVTYRGDLAGFPLDPRSLLIEYEGMQLQRDFYSPVYDTEERRQSRLPDFRNLLYWSPEVRTGPEGQKALEWYTSDQPGNYMIVVQGMDRKGRVGSAVRTFEVKGAL